MCGLDGCTGMMHGRGRGPAWRRGRIPKGIYRHGRLKLGALKSMEKIHGIFARGDRRKYSIVMTAICVHGATMLWVGRRVGGTVAT